MNTDFHSRRAFCRTLAASAVFPTLAVAADDAPIQVMVNAGVTMDATARIVAEQLHKYLGRDAIVLQKLGAGGRVAMSSLKNMSTDGRNVLVSAGSVLTIAPIIYKSPGYDADKDFSAITGLVSFDNAVAVGPQSPAKTLGDLIKLAAARPDGLVYGAVPGTGSSSHFMGMSLAMLGGFKATVVPYKEAQSAFGDLATGRLEALISGTGAMVPLHKAGQLRLLASSGPQRSPLLPELPTFKESGSDVVTVNGTLLLGPAKVPADVVNRLHDAVAKAMNDPAVVSRLAVLGMTPWPLGPSELGAWLQSERQRYTVLAKANNYVPE